MKRLKKLAARISERFPLPEFIQEWRAVREGMARYRAHSSGTGHYLLRRSLHRIEKGLMMPAGRNVFATDYIEETVDTYTALCREVACEQTREEMRWAHRILQAYFDRDLSHAAVVRARKQFEALTNPATAKIGEQGFLPMRQRDLGPAPLSPEQLMAALRHRKSVRWFQQKSVPRNLLDQAISAAATAPSACNRQAFHFMMLDTPDKIHSVTSLLLGVSGFDHQIPVLAIVIGNLRGYEHARDRHLIYVDGGLAAMNFMLAIDALGLASCPVNWPDQPRENMALESLLNLESDQRAVMCIAIGYPDPEGMVAHSQRKSIEELRSYI